MSREEIMHRIGIEAAIRSVMFARCPLDGGSVTITFFFFEIRVRKSIVYGIISHDSIETKRKSTWWDHYLGVYLELDAYMFLAFVLFQTMRRSIETSRDLSCQCYYDMGNQWNENAGKRKM